MMRFPAVILFSAILAWPTTGAGLCAPLGAIFPPTRVALSTNKEVRKAAANLTSIFTSLLESDNITSLAVQVTSLADSEPLFEFYRTAAAVNRTGAQHVTSQTQFRIASVTKVFTVLAMLQHEKSFDWKAPISKYIPELLSNNASNEVKAVRWEEVTLDALASQLGGIPRDIQDLGLLYELPWADFGFPPLNSSELPTCGVATHLPPCNASEYINAIKIRHPAYTSYAAPVYSNAAYALLGLALERIVERKYETIIQQGIFDVLGMMDSSIETPDPERMLIPTGDSQWDVEDGFLRPTGQLYSSIADLSTFALSILNSTLLDKTQTNRWLKPRSHTSSLTASVGAPWEIYRTTALTRDGRVIDLYTKNGGLGQFVSYLVLLPDYNVAITVLMAGQNNPLNQITEATLATMIPAIDAVFRVNAAKKYAGKYESSQGNSNMSIVMTDSGLHVKEWFNDGKDILAAYAGVFQPFELMMYPTGLSSTATSLPKCNSKEESWRGIYRFNQDSQSDILNQCLPWLGIDGNVYGQGALDEFVFAEDGDEEIASVRNSAVRTILFKK